jgi:hypothetical protein
MVVQIDAVAQSESQLTKSSKAFFLKQDYNKALDGYRQLLSNDLSNIDYNYRYAVCLFYTKSPKSSETYFNYLMEQSDCPIEVFFFKGKLHHINYQFDDAIALYSKYLSLKTKKSKDFSCAEEIVRCQNAKELLKSPRAIQVAGQEARSVSDYFSAYLFDSINYKLYTVDDFNKKVNAKKGFSPKYVFKRGMKYRFFSSFRADGNGGKELFYQKKNKDNEWEEPILLPASVNSELDEDYPFYDEQKDILYFSSTGHNSMGGFDLFRIPLTLKSMETGLVENLNFPYSSTSNDFLFVPNLPGENVFFTTDRNEDIGALKVIEARFNAPVLSSLVASLYFKDAIDSKNKSATFYITNESSKERFGPYKTNKEGVVYFMVPTPGAYLFEANVEGSTESFSDIIDVPPHVEGFEFEVNANYQMIASKEAISYNQNLIELSDMVVDIESIELHEFEKLTINTKTIDVANDLAVEERERPLDDGEIQIQIERHIDMELELEDRIRQKVKLIESISDLYAKNGEVDEKIELILAKENVKTQVLADSINKILYDLIIDRKVIVSSLIAQNDYNNQMKELDVLESSYQSLITFNEEVEEFKSTDLKDSLNALIKASEFKNITDLSGYSPVDAVRSSLNEKEALQIDIKNQIVSTEARESKLEQQKKRLIKKIEDETDIQTWSVLEDSLNRIETEISSVNTSKADLQEKEEILEGELIYAREGLLNITLIDAEGIVNVDIVETLEKQPDIDKYASAELYVKDQIAARQNLETLTSIQVQERFRLEQSKFTNDIKDSIALKSEYEHIVRLNQYRDQEPLVSEVEVSTLRFDAEAIIEALNKKSKANDNLISNIEISTSKKGNSSIDNDVQFLGNSDKVITKQSELSQNTNPQASSQVDVTQGIAEENTQIEKGNSETTTTDESILNSEPNLAVINIAKQDLDSEVSSNDPKIETNIKEQGTIGITSNNISNDELPNNEAKSYEEILSNDKNTSSEQNSNTINMVDVDINNTNSKNEALSNSSALNLDLTDSKVPETSKANAVNSIENSSAELEINQQTNEITLNTPLKSEDDEASEQTAADGTNIISNDIEKEQVKLINNSVIQPSANNNNQSVAENKLNNSISKEINPSLTSGEQNETSVNINKLELNIDSASQDVTNRNNQNNSTSIDGRSTALNQEEFEDIVSNKDKSSFKEDALGLTGNLEGQILNESNEFQNNEPEALEVGASAIPSTNVPDKRVVDETENIADEKAISDKQKKEDIAQGESFKRNEAESFTDSSQAIYNDGSSDDYNPLKSSNLGKGSSDKTPLTSTNLTNPQNTSFTERLKDFDFEAKPIQAKEFDESIKLLTALILDTELEINAENTTPEPKRKKDKVIAIENKREKAKRLAFYQKELDLELTHQNIENKYLRLKALLPGIQFETKENLKAQLLEIAIKDQDLNKRLTATTPQNEIDMLRKLIQANQSRKLMIEQELEEMRDFSENELQLSSTSLNDREIAEVLESEQYRSYVEKRQKLEEANTLLNQLIIINQKEMQTFDRSLRGSKNDAELTSEQEQSVKTIRRLQQAIIYLEEEIKLRKIELLEQNTSGEFEYLYQNELNPFVKNKEIQSLVTIDALNTILNDSKAEHTLSEYNQEVISSVNRNNINSEKKLSGSSQSQFEISSGQNATSSRQKDQKIYPSEVLIQVNEPLLILESENYKRYTQDRVLADRLAKELIELPSNQSLNTDDSESLSTIQDQNMSEQSIINDIRQSVIKQEEIDTRNTLESKDLQETANFVVERKRVLLEQKLNQTLNRLITEYIADSAGVYEALVQKTFAETSDEKVGFNQSLKSLDLVDYSNRNVSASDFTVLNSAVISKNKESFEIDSPNPSGLNFRVQVGAFRRPVREDVYREFTPVSGQKLRNGLIVYMAGYFNNSIMAVQAQREIRAMGYSDAFIVAYCNDERLPFWKGKEYERNGNCIADGENSFFVANQNGSSSSSERTLENLVSVNIKSDDSIDSDLNEVENKSDSISNIGISEIRNDIQSSQSNNSSQIQAGRVVGSIDVKGLFYSVQVGAFNRQIRGNELSQIRDLDYYESRGLYRYSSGKFNSIEDARDRKAEVVQKGISDAFLVVYFNGERITMQKAKSLINAQGASVLFKEKTYTDGRLSINAVDSTKPVEYNNTQTSNENKIEMKPKSLMPSKAEMIKQKTAYSVNIIDRKKKKSKDLMMYSLATDTLDQNSIERLNRVGVFHYNADSSQIQSQVFATENMNAILSFYTNGMVLKSFDLEQYEVYSVKIQTKLKGAIGNWLLRSNRIFRFSELEGELYLVFYVSSIQEKNRLIEELKEIIIE